MRKGFALVAVFSTLFPAIAQAERWEAPVDEEVSVITCAQLVEARLGARGVDVVGVAEHTQLGQGFMVIETPEATTFDIPSWDTFIPSMIRCVEGLYPY